MRRRSRRVNNTLAGPLIDHAEASLAQVETALASLAAAVRSGAPQAERRRRHATLRRAFLDADTALRGLVTNLAAAPYPLRSKWRGRLSDLDVAKQQHLFIERDDGAVLAPGTVRATDTGMSSPDLHDHIHGRVLVAGSPATYGLSLPAYTDRLDIPVPEAAVGNAGLDAVPHLVASPVIREVHPPVDSGADSAESGADTVRPAHQAA